MFDTDGIPEKLTLKNEQTTKTFKITQQAKDKSTSVLRRKESRLMNLHSCMLLSKLRKVASNFTHTHEIGNL